MTRWLEQFDAAVTWSEFWVLCLVIFVIVAVIQLVMLPAPHDDDRD